MSPIASVFRAKTHCPLLVPFIPAGFPHPRDTVGLLHTLSDAGADLIELGIPFSDPTADGPVIQQASSQAIGEGQTLAGALVQIAEYQQSGGTTPIILMGYCNSFLAMGLDAFAEQARGLVGGVIVVDLAGEDVPAWKERLHAADIDYIPLVAPTTSAERRRHLARQIDSFCYFVSMRGTTGATHIAPSAIRDDITALREAMESPHPVAVGFGIHTADVAKQIGAFADAVVIGSALVDHIAQHGVDAVGAFLQPFQTACEAAR